MLKHTPSVYIPVEPKDNGLLIPFILSLVVHVLIVAFIFFTHRVPHITPTQSIETSIITQAELEAIEARIGANREAMESGITMDSNHINGANINSTNIGDNTETADADINFDFDNRVEETYQKSTSSTSPTASTNTSELTQPLDDQDLGAQNSEENNSLITPLDQEPDSNGFDAESIREKERIYQEKIAQFAAELDAELEAQRQQILDERELEDIRRAALVEEYKKKAQEPKTADQNQSSRVKVETPPAEESGVQTARLSSSDSDNNSRSHGGSSGRSTRSGATARAAQVDTASIQAQLKQLIYSRWSPPTGSTGKQVTALVTVNTNTGRVTNVRVTGADNIVLEQSLEDAINSGPLTPVIGTNLSTLRLVLNAR